jgi:molybdenum cofactor biosynthesis enzyme MoaA
MERNTQMNRSIFIDDTLRIAVTNSCNLSCFYCHNEGQPHTGKRQNISMDYIKSIVRFVKKYDVPVAEVSLTGGEPFLHPDIFSIIDECNNITDNLRINTNATLLTKQKIDTIVKRGVKELKIGIDSLSSKQSKPNLFTTSRKIQDTLDIIKYANEKMLVSFNTVITKYNKEHFNEIFEFAKENGIPRLKVFALHGQNARTKQDNISEEESFFESFYADYLAKSIKVEDVKGKARTDMLIPIQNGKVIEIDFLQDFCKGGACGNVYTQITAYERLGVCLRDRYTMPLDFNNSFKAVKKVLDFNKFLRCNNSTNTWFYKNSTRETIDNFVKDAYE